MPSLLTSEEARQQARSEGLALLKANNKVGYFGVSHQPGKPKPYQAKVRRGGKDVTLGSNATAEEAALCIARPEGRAAARRAAATPPLTSEEADMVEVEAEAELVAVEEAEDVQWVVAEVMEVVTVVEHEDVVGEGGRSEGRAKRRRNA